MKVYHGGLTVVKCPLILESQRLLDFGMGFYTTTNREQAEKWALIKKRREEDEAKAIVNVFELNEKFTENPLLRTKHFEVADESWLDFVITNRRDASPHNYDIVRGAVANDTLYSTLLLFETGVLTKPETIVRLKTHTLFDQISFHSTEALAELKFLESYEL